MITFELFTDRPVSKVNSHARLEKVFQQKKKFKFSKFNLYYLFFR